MDAAEHGTALADLTGAGLNRRRHCCGISIFVLMALFLVIFAYQAPSALATQEEKEYTAGVPANFPPQYQVESKTGKPYGFAIDIMDEVARQSGIKVRYVVYGNFSEVIAALRKGEIDVVPNLGITDERKNYTDFTMPYEAFHIHIFVRSTTEDIKNPDDLTGRKVAVVAENQGYFIMKERGRAKLLVYNSMEEALMSLISGNADAMVYPEETLLRMARQAGVEDHIKTTGDALAEIKRTIGVRKGQPELYNKLDETVKAFVLTPEYEKLYLKWYGKPEQYWNTERVLVALGITIALATAIFFVFHYFSVLRLNKRLEESITQIKKNRQQLQSILDNTPLIIFIKDMNGRYVLFNRQWEKLFDPNRKDLHGMTDNEIFPPALADELRANDRMVIESRTSVNFEESARISDGTIHTYISTKFPLFDEAGETYALCGISTDITERKRVDEELRAERERFTKIAKTAPGAICSFRQRPDGSADFPYASPVIQDVYGLQPEDLAQDASIIRDLIHPDDMKHVRETITESARTMSPWRDEYRFRHPKKGEIWIESHFMPEREADGSTIWQGIITDITERKLAEEVLRENEQRLASIYNTVGDVILHLAVEPAGQFRFVSVNTAFLKITGLSQEMVVGRTVNEIIPEPSLTMVLGKYRQAIEENTIVRWEETSDYPTGRLIGEVRIAPVFNDKGTCTHLVGSVHDITEHKKAEATLRESESRYRSLFENMIEGFAYCKMFYEDGKPTDFIYLNVNEAFEKLTGLKNVVGKKVTEVIPNIKKDSPELLETYGRVALTGKPERFEVYLESIAMWFYISVYSNEKEYFIAVFDVITERKRGEEELRKHRDHLEELVKERTALLTTRTNQLTENQSALMGIVEELNRATAELEKANIRLKELDHLKSMFIASTSHELRTPLNSIIGFSSIMLEGWSGELTSEQVEQVQLIHNSGKQLLALINDVIDISKIESGKIDAYFTEFRLKEMIGEAIATLRKSIDDKGLSLSVDVPDIIMRTDRRRLLQCILNYLSNAVKFTEKGSIAIIAKSINKRIDISIKDTGIGITDEGITKLFQPFVRLESPLSIEAGGTGLGLYLTKKLAEEVLGGAVRVKSIYGKGSTFSLCIPLEQEDKA